MFNRYKIVKHWHTPTEFSIRIYTRQFLFFYEYTEGGFNSVDDAENRIKHWTEVKAAQKAFEKSFPKDTVEKYL